MRTLGLSILLMTSVAMSVALGASSSVKKMNNAKAKSSATASKAKAEYGTSYSFNGANIKGKFQEGNMRRIVVENDKSLEDLLGVRKNFDDREREESERNLSW